MKLLDCQVYCNILCVRVPDYQARLESEFGTDFIDKSLRDTVMWLLTANHNARAESIKKDFKIADRQYAMWKVSALAIGQQWVELDHYAKNKKAPFGLLVGLFINNFE